jgi:hypothetical protein
MYYADYYFAISAPFLRFFSPAFVFAASFRLPPLLFSLSRHYFADIDFSFIHFITILFSYAAFAIVSCHFRHYAMPPPFFAAAIFAHFAAILRFSLMPRRSENILSEAPRALVERERRVDTRR